MSLIIVSAVLVTAVCAALVLAFSETGRGILEWCYRKAVAAGFGAVLIIVLVGIEAWLIKSFLAVDATFIRPLAPPGIDPQILQDISWALRAFGVIVGMALVYFHAQGMVKWFKTFRWLAGACAALLFCHAMGLAFKSMDDQYKTKSANTQIQTQLEAGDERRVAAIDSQIAGIRSDRDTANQLLQRSIDSITNDGLDNDDEARIFGEQQQSNTTEAKEKIDELEAEKRAILEAGVKARNQNVEASATNDGIADLFTGLARIVTLSFNPDHEPSIILAFAIGIIFWVTWYGFGEALMILIPPASFAIVLRHASNTKDPIRVEAGKKAAETRKRKQEKKITLRDPDGYRTQWWQDRVKKAQESAVGLTGIANYYFEPWTESELAGQLKVALKKQQITQDQYDDLTDPDRVERRKRERQEARERRTADEKQAPLQLTNGMDQGTKEKGDVDQHGDAGSVSGN